MPRSKSVDPDEPLTISEVCQITKLGRTKIFQLITLGELASFQSGEGRTCKRFVYRREVTAYLNRRAAQGKAGIRPPRGRRQAPRADRSAA